MKSALEVARSIWQEEINPETGTFSPIALMELAILRDRAQRLEYIPLDPEPWTVHSGDFGIVRFSREDDCWPGYRANFEPRPGYSQNREDYYA